MNNIVMIIVGMTLVTYLPRLAPFVVINTEKLPMRVRRFLGYIPCAMLGAMIMPGVFTSIPGGFQAASISIGLGAVVAYYRESVILPIVVAIMAAVVLQI